MPVTAKSDLPALRSRLSQARGRAYWRTLEELAESPQFEALLRREFPRQAAAWDPSLSRRDFLKLMGAALALAGAGSLVGACSSPAPPREQIVPYVRQPEPVLPGKPLFFATTFPLAGYGLGVLAESQAGRPTKLEGNPSHPASLGATDAFAQAAVLSLYDPDRSQAPRFQGEIRPFAEFLRDLSRVFVPLNASGGAGLYLLTETVTSPSLAAQITALLERFPEARWHQYQPVNRDTVRAGAQLAFGRYVETVYHFDRADVVLALDGDFLDCQPRTLRYARDFAARRRAYTGAGGMNRLYAVESTLTPTGAAADHRLPLRSSEIEGLAWALATRLGLGNSVVPLPRAVPEAWLAALLRDLEQHRGRSLIIAGDGQPAAVHALAHAVNAALGNVGQTLTHHEPVEANPADETASLRQLVDDMAAGRVAVLFIIGGNPAYASPADIAFGHNLASVPFSVHLSLYHDETSAATTWHLPQAHFLESWGDVRAFDGTVSLIQPLIAPLYGGLSALELVALLAGESDPSGHDLLRRFWQGQLPGADFDLAWRTALHDGLIAGSTLPTLDLPSPQLPITNYQLPDSNTLELTFRPDPSVHDGQFANNAWLQELPQPITTLTWDNAALMSPATAERLGVANGRVVELRYRGRSVKAPVLIMPGHAPDSVTVHLGYGRTRAGHVGGLGTGGPGFNAYSLRTADAPWFGFGLEVVPTGDEHRLALTQTHHLIEGRDILRAGTLPQYQADPEFAHAADEAAAGEAASFYPEYEYSGNRWGMAIDLSACVGCNACIAACQAENNIPVVGKDQVARGREMHWLRVDSYFAGSPDQPQTFFQPVPCMHCETAPCEPVCPVAATVHSDDGLNDMVYNRCIGTRYCSNNCPYKVRRFNFLQFQDLEATPSLKLAQNPAVSVRTRGVMEKCTYCVQRIRAGQAEAALAGQPIADGQVETACQGACPTQAIVFGDLNDPTSRVAQLKAQPLNYAMLAELNTQPRTTYLAAVRNPNPELESM